MRLMLFFCIVFTVVALWAVVCFALEGCWSAAVWCLLSVGWCWNFFGEWRKRIALVESINWLLSRRVIRDEREGGEG